MRSSRADLIAELESLKHDFFFSTGLTFKLSTGISNFEMHSLYEEAIAEDIPYTHFAEFIRSRALDSA